jgi:CDP-diacylglycerol--serine O-phosphatidyltransferase
MFLRPNKQKKIVFTKVKFRRGIQIIPNIFTLGNSFFGFCSIIFAAQQSWIAAAFCIFVGALMDALDGQIARLVRVSSDLGLQLDSLSDAITFCLAPAFLIYMWQLKRLGVIGVIICGLFLAAGLLRLAKFNITHSEQSEYFIGVPTPFAACFLAAFVLKFHQFYFKNIFGLFLLLFIMLILSGLMVDTVRIPTFKHVKKNLYLLIASLFTAGAIVLGFVTVVFYIFTAYIIFALSKSLYYKTIQIVKYIKLRFQPSVDDQDFQELLFHK